jgi:GDP-L-fucose synthase
VYVAGHRGLVGSALVRRLEDAGHTCLLTAPRGELDLRDPAAVGEWFWAHRPEYVFVAAGTVGGILANSTRPAEFIHDNLMIQAAIASAAHATGVRKLLYLASSCAYPRDCPQPIPETALLSGPLEPTNEAYAVAKIAGIKLCEAYRRQYGCNFISVMPTNLYGPHDNFEATGSHVVPALMRRFHEARQAGQDTVVVWGSGRPRREFLHVDDLADAVVFLMNRYDGLGPINVGTGEDLTIEALARLIGSIVHPDAAIVFDTTQPDGTPAKRLDVTKLHALGWRHRIALREGLTRTYQWFLDHQTRARGMAKDETRCPGSA